MVAILSTPKPPATACPRRPPSDRVYCSTVESRHTEDKIERHFKWTVIILYVVLVVLITTALVYNHVNNSSIDIIIPSATRNQSITLAHDRIGGKLKESNIHFIQITFYAMARFQHPGNVINVDSITVSIFNEMTRIGGGIYRSSSIGGYPLINNDGDITTIAILPKATLLEGEIGYKECSSSSNSRITLRVFFSISINKKTIFGNSIYGNVEYSQLYSICCSCHIKNSYIRV